MESDDQLGDRDSQTPESSHNQSSSYVPPTSAAKRRKVDVDLSELPEEEFEESKQSSSNNHNVHSSSSSNGDVEMLTDEDQPASSNRVGRPVRKAKSEANQRVAAMANSLMDDTEVGGKRKTPANSHTVNRPSNNSNAAASSTSNGRSASSSYTRRNNSTNSSSRKRPLVESSPDRDVMIVEDVEEEEPDVEEIPPPNGADNMDVDGPEEDEPDEPKGRVVGKRAGLSRAAAMQTLQKLQQKTGRKTAGATRHNEPRAAAASSSSSSNHTSAAAASSSSSSSATAAATAANATKPKKIRDMRRDKRASGFGPWKLVHKLSIPAMTLEGYEDLARQGLEVQTHDEIRKSQPYSPQGTDCYHKDPTDILKGKAEMPLSLLRRVDTKYGREEYKVQASRTIEKKEVVTFLGGRLMEQVKANKQVRDEWNQHFHMKKEWLDEFFMYKGQHDLVVSTTDHRCIGSYIRGPEERTDGKVGANLKADVVFQQKEGLFLVIYYALERIRRGEEVFCMPFLGDWHDRCHREMFLHSRISHYYHKWAKILEENLLALGQKVDYSVPANMRPVILSADQEEKFLAIPGMDQGVLPEPMDPELSMKVVNVEEAMDYCQCTYSAKAVQKGLSVETEHYIEAVGDFIPDYLEITSEIEGEEDEDGEPVFGVTKFYVDHDEVLALIESGYRADCLELREELGIHSPVRHFTPPNYRAFCVVATKPIPKGTFVFAYAGEITEEVENRDSAYVYVMEREQIRRTVKSYHGPDLSLDALKVGNISRFVNDNTYRMGEAEEKGSTANLETQFLFVNGTIHLGFYTTRDIEPKEELVSQYGEDYWKTINKQLIDEHKRFFDYINPYTRKLEQMTYKLQGKLPPHPPEDWRTPGEELFTEKPLPYPKLHSPDENLFNEDGTHQVERILQMREEWDGTVWYFVKWLNASSANNSWIKESQIIDCVDLINEFQEAEANRHRGKKSSTKKNSTKKK